jgi:NADP-dependent 3-hydroxy acid dehydrogenase YdfG
MVESIAGRRVMLTNGVYAATKHAVRLIAESLRLEGGTAIRSALIAPGATQAELFENIVHPQIRDAARARAESALPADAIARACAIEQPEGVDVNEITVRPMIYKWPDV